MIQGLQKLLDRRNLLALAGILVGLLGIFGIPQKIGFDVNQIIIGLLIVVSVEAIIINLGYLDNILTSISAIQKKIYRPELDSLVGPRKDRFEIADFSDDVREMVVLAIAPENFIMGQFNLLLQMAERKAKICFVTLDPQATFLNEIDKGMPNHVGEHVLKANIASSQRRLAQLYSTISTKQRHRLEVRKYSGIPFYSGVRIKSRSGTNDVIWISYYSYGGAISERKGILIFANTSPNLFSYYSQATKRLWDASVPIALDNLAP